MGSFKKLNKADITTVPYYANKQWNIPLSSGASGSDGIVFLYTGQNTPYTPAGSSINGQNYSLVYSSMNHMFYQTYTGSLDTGSLMFNVNTLQSASQQRPTASYFDYNASPYQIKNFPTGANENIRVVSIDKQIYGNEILPESFIISSSGVYVTDDGYGNLYSVANGYLISNYINLGYITVGYFASASLPAGLAHAGNIFYAHGIAVLTNQDLISHFDVPLTTPLNISFQNEHIIHENEINCIVRESDFNLTYNPTIVTGSYYTTGVVRNFATASAFQPYVTTIGLYNDENDLLMVAKLAKPIVLSSDTDMTFIVKYDT